MRKYILINALILFVSGCATTEPIKPVSEIMSGEAQSTRLMLCTSLNLDYQIKLDKNHDVIDITCKPRYNHEYLPPKAVPNGAGGASGSISPTSPQPQNGMVKVLPETKNEYVEINDTKYIESFTTPEMTR